MPTSALAAVIGLCATTIGIQIRFFSVLKTDMRSLNGNIVNLGDHVERVEERLNRRIDRVEERLGNRIDRVEENLGQRIELVKKELNDRIDRVEEGLGQRIDHVEQSLGQRIELVSSDLTVVGRDVAHVKGQWDTMLTFLPYQKAESVVTSLPS